MTAPAPLPITPETKVAQLLDAYPDLEKVLVEAAPPFKKLANPVLRRTIARVTTLDKAAEVAGISARELVGSLREAAGLARHDAAQPPTGDSAELGDEASADWVDASCVRWTVDADAFLEQGTHPIAEVQRRTADLGPADLGLIRSSFRPAPLIEMLEGQGFRIAVVRSGESYATFVGPKPL